VEVAGSNPVPPTTETGRAVPQITALFLFCSRRIFEPSKADKEKLSGKPRMIRSLHVHLEVRCLLSKKAGLSHRHHGISLKKLLM
jgi:hypothetical protein